MIENSDDLMQFSSPIANLSKTIVTQKTPKSLLDTSINSENKTLVNESSTKINDDLRQIATTTTNLNESKLDNVDFIEVNELDQEDFWLCEPDKRKASINENNKENVNNLLVSNKKSKNPYKWIVEEFDEDKNLDKVKRTLLVTLDDISKGFSKALRFFSKNWINFLS